MLEIEGVLNLITRAVVVAQLVEWSLPIPGVSCLNPVIGKHLKCTFTVNCIEKTKIKKKRPRMDHLKKPLITNEVSIKFLKALI